MGEIAFRDAVAKLRESRNDHWNQILQRAGGRLAEQAKRAEYHWEFRLIESREKNAFCLPGGKAAYFTGLFAESLNEAGVAAVLAHEIAHGLLGHAGRRIPWIFKSPPTMPELISFLDTGPAHERQQLLGALGLNTQLGAVLPFSPSQEVEADQEALRLLASAGYDPAASVPVWEHLARGTGATILAQHPWTVERASALRAEAAKAQGTYRNSPHYGLGGNL